MPSKDGYRLYDKKGNLMFECLHDDLCDYCSMKNKKKWVTCQHSKDDRIQIHACEDHEMQAGVEWASVSLTLYGEPASSDWEPW